MNGAGVLAVAANQDQNESHFLLLRPVIMRGELTCYCVLINLLKTLRNCRQLSRYIWETVKVRPIITTES